MDLLLLPPAALIGLRGDTQQRMHAYMCEVTDDHCTPEYQQQIAR